MNRLWPFLPLVPFLAAVVAWLSPPSPSTLAYYPSMVSYSVLRANIFVGSFYASAIIATVVLCLRPSKLTTIIGLAACFSLLNVVYLWTADHFVTFQWLVWAAWSPTNGIGFFMLDWLTVGMVGLSGAVVFVPWIRKGATLAIFRALEVASLAVLLLPTYILVFDYGEFYLHVANVGPAWLTNQDLLVGAAMLLVTILCVDFLVYHKRIRRIVSSALDAPVTTTSPRRRQEEYNLTKPYRWVSAGALVAATSAISVMAYFGLRILFLPNFFSWLTSPYYLSWQGSGPTIAVVNTASGQVIFPWTEWVTLDGEFYHWLFISITISILASAVVLPILSRRIRLIVAAIYVLVTETAVIGWVVVQIGSVNLGPLTGILAYEGLLGGTLGGQGFGHEYTFALLFALLFWSAFLSLGLRRAIQVDTVVLASLPTLVWFFDSGEWTVHISDIDIRDLYWLTNELLFAVCVATFSAVTFIPYVRRWASHWSGRLGAGAQAE